MGIQSDKGSVAQVSRADHQDPSGEGGLCADRRKRALVACGGDEALLSPEFQLLDRIVHPVDWNKGRPAQ